MESCHENISSADIGVCFVVKEIPYVIPGKQQKISVVNFDGLKRLSQ